MIIDVEDPATIPMVPVDLEEGGDFYPDPDVRETIAVALPLGLQDVSTLALEQDSWGFALAWYLMADDSGAVSATLYASIAARSSTGIDSGTQGGNAAPVIAEGGGSGTLQPGGVSPTDLITQAVADNAPGNETILRAQMTIAVYQDAAGALG